MKNPFVFRKNGVYLQQIKKMKEKNKTDLCQLKNSKEDERKAVKSQQDSKLKKLLKGKGIPVLVIVSGSAGASIFLLRFSEEDLNIWQSYKGVSKYKTKKPIGYAFEDLTIRYLQRSGYSVSKVREYKDGADIKVNGQEVQIKCFYPNYKDLKATIKNILYSDGKYRYYNQSISTNADVKGLVYEICEEQKALGYGGPNEYLSLPITYEEAKKVCYRGWNSLKADATSNSFIKTIAFCVVIIFVGGMVYEYFSSKEKLVDSWKKKALKWGKISVSSALILGIAILGYKQFIRTPNPYN